MSPTACLAAAAVRVSALLTVPAVGVKVNPEDVMAPADDAYNEVGSAKEASS